MTESEKTNKEIRDRVKNLMIDKEITQAELCRRADINKATLSNFLSGRYGLRQTSLYKISKALNVPITWLLFGDTSGDELTDEELLLVKYHRELNTELQERLMATGKALYEYGKTLDAISFGGGYNENNKTEQ